MLISDIHKYNEHRVDEEGLGIMPTKTSHRISATLPGNQIKVKADSSKTTISSWQGPKEPTNWNYSLGYQVLTAYIYLTEHSKYVTRMKINFKTS